VLIENQVTHKPQEFRWIADLGIGVNLKKITLLAQLGGESPSDLCQCLGAMPLEMLRDRVSFTNSQLVILVCFDRISQGLLGILVAEVELCDRLSACLTKKA